METKRVLLSVLITAEIYLYVVKKSDKKERRGTQEILVQQGGMERLALRDRKVPLDRPRIRLQLVLPHKHVTAQVG